MLNESSAAVKPQKGLGDHLAVRAALLVRGRTLKSFARAHGVSIELVRQVISGRCAGRRGKAAAVRSDLVAALKR